MRIVSLLPSATEILFALDLDREIAGVSHECDFPPQARSKPVVIHSRLPHDAAPAEIDRLVREYVSRGESLYAVDVDKLEGLDPDLIESFKLVDIHCVQTLAAGDIFAHEPINLSRSSIMRQTRMNDYGFAASLRRKVAFVADARDFAIQVERKKNLRGRR